MLGRLSCIKSRLKYRVHKFFPYHDCFPLVDSKLYVDLGSWSFIVAPHALSQSSAGLDNANVVPPKLFFLFSVEHLIGALASFMSASLDGICPRRGLTLPEHQ